ncbi:Prolyl oligopeptidase, N-terminal beta-propeller domain [Arthrobacter subterraneus]|uniref:Prolyl oligopeptidase, N-terminal beta-propeller domain n=1 Tax=Arthrobacter subterraneus TaxID=335973 RepID=A0A1G8KHT1_9MICC|nr:Prolyl oligopeptidase, N-terminal beta-propeller domain [Arthrobacter subterraneus]
MTSTTQQPDSATDDEFLWLEDIYGQKPLEWVRSQNAVTEAELVNKQFLADEQRLLEVLDSTDRIPMVVKRGDHYYNFWRDREHPKGLWRRTTWESYLTDAPDWDVLLDVDALAAAEGQEWVWGGAMFLRPTDGGPYRRALIALSPDGGDAQRYREYDVVDRSFVEGGFDIPVAKSRISWAGPDALHVGTDFGPGSMTTSSYPRTVRTLRRGEPLESARLYFEIPETSMMAVVVRDQTPGFERDIAAHIVDFYSSRTFLRRGDEWVHIDVPDDVNVSLHREWLVLRPRTDFELDGVTYRGGSLQAAHSRTSWPGSAL